MSVRFCVLGSGSAGNAALLITPRARVLIDAGFAPEDLAARMQGTGASWETLTAAVLTHPHQDHLARRNLAEFARLGIPFFCHTEHGRALAGGRYFKKLLAAERVRTYDGAAPFEPAAGVRFLPLRLPHDCAPTFGFRIEVAHGAGPARTLGYLADLGNAAEALVQSLRDVDLLALEFNHDEELERASGRPWDLVARVLGDEGHLSNRQAAEFYERLARASSRGGPKFLVQLHLSADCNRPRLAYQAAREVSDKLGAATEIFTSKQDCRGSVHVIA